MTRATVSPARERLRRCKYSTAEQKLDWLAAAIGLAREVRLRRDGTARRAKSAAGRSRFRRS
jgi:hypothetical protein